VFIGNNIGVNDMLFPKIIDAAAEAIALFSLSDIKKRVKVDEEELNIKGAPE
jgi:hypothetical protein